VTPPVATAAEIRRAPSILGPGRAARRLWRSYGGSALGFASLFLIWHLASRYLVSSVLFPPPTVVFAKAWVR